MIAMDQHARSATSSIVAPFPQASGRKTSSRKRRRPIKKFLHQFKLGPNQLNRDLEESFNKGIIRRVSRSHNSPLPAANLLVVPVETVDEKELRLRAEKDS